MLLNQQKNSASEFPLEKSLRERNRRKNKSRCKNREKRAKCRINDREYPHRVGAFKCAMIIGKSPRIVGRFVVKTKLRRNIEKKV